METSTPELSKSPAQPDLAAVIQQSTENLQQAAEPKRGRGRPTGWRKYPDGKPTDTQNPQGGTPSEAKSARNVAGDVVKINEIEPLAAELVKAPFDYLGWRSGLDITPTDEEAKAPTKYLSKLIDAYLPDLESKDPKVFAWVALGISYSLLALKKLRLLFAKKAEQAANESRTEIIQDDSGHSVVVDETAPVLPAQTVAAGDFFKRNF